MAKEHDEFSLNKLKDIDYPATKLNPAGTGGTPSRGFELHSEDYANPTEARSIAGSGHQGFGRGGSGPDTTSGGNRGQFASRNPVRNEKLPTGGSKGHLLPGEKD